jgi:hypothetical protein
MRVTLANVSSSAVFIPSFYITLQPGASVTTTRTMPEIDFDLSLKQLLLAGTVTLTKLGDAWDAEVSYPGVGTQGVQGWQNAVGVQGSRGIQGFQGTGVQGAQGWQNAIGVQGPQGWQGRQGWQGWQGVQAP